MQNDADPLQCGDMIDRMLKRERRVMAEAEV